MSYCQSDSIQHEQTETCSPTKRRPATKFVESFEDAPRYAAILTYICYAGLVLFGYIRDAMRFWGLEKSKGASESRLNKGFVPLYSDWDSFFTRNLYLRVRDCWNRPISSAPGAQFRLVDRVTTDYGWHFQNLKTSTSVINMGSYNYLDFGSLYEPCIRHNRQAISQYGLGGSSSRHEFGNLDLHRQLEELVAEYVGMEDAICFQMGFATNSMNIPALLGKGDLIISDELNHSSLILGSRLSGASIRVFKHNDMALLENTVRDAIAYGQPHTRRAWRRILILVEGIYSMEGSIVNLPQVIRIKKKYRTYLYVDEAHSIGALGPRGRGVVDYFGCDPRDIDILMGTFTKSFASAGGYIAGSAKLIEYLRARSHSLCYACSVSPPIARQIIASMRILMGRECGPEGQRRIDQLAANTRYFRRRLQDMGFIIYGNDDSPIVPLLIYLPTKVAAFSRMCLKRGLGVVVVGYPATPLIEARARFCLSSGHTREMLDKALAVIEEVGAVLTLRYNHYKEQGVLRSCWSAATQGAVVPLEPHPSDAARAQAQDAPADRCADADAPKPPDSLPLLDDHLLPLSVAVGFAAPLSIDAQLPDLLVDASL